MREPTLLINQSLIEIKLAILGTQHDRFISVYKSNKPHLYRLGWKPTRREANSILGCYEGEELGAFDVLGRAEGVVLGGSLGCALGEAGTILGGSEGEELGAFDVLGRVEEAVLGSSLGRALGDDSTTSLSCSDEGSVDGANDGRLDGRLEGRDEGQPDGSDDG